jgi:hypothetical protein
MPRPPTQRKISRFIVMAMLQAARAERLGLAKDSAYSWGLNRAIFFAAAKRGFRGGGGGGPGEGGSGGAAPHSEAHASREPYQVGDEFAFRDATQSKLYFTIGEETQTEKEFEQQIAARFGDRKNFASAWREAEKIVADADLESVRSGREFYARVYKPRRDALSAKWTEEFVGGSSAPAT